MGKLPFKEIWWRKKILCFFCLFVCFCFLNFFFHHRYTCVPHPEPSSLLPLPSLWVVPVHQPQASSLVQIGRVKKRRSSWVLLGGLCNLLSQTGKTLRVIDNCSRTSSTSQEHLGQMKTQDHSRHYQNRVCIVEVILWKQQWFNKWFKLIGKTY